MKGEKNCMQKNINEEFLKNRMEEIKKEKDENSKYLSLKNGENIVKIDLGFLPEKVNGKFGTRYVYTTCIKKGERQLFLSASPMLDGLIIKALSEGINPFTLIKVGEGKNTRYAIKEIEEIKNE